MSSVLKLITSVMVLTAGMGAAVAVAAPGQAPARHATSMIVCPVTASAGSIVPCCGPPLADPTVQPICCPLVTTCCGTPLRTDCPVMLTALSSADPSTAGHKVTISGHWTSGTGGQTIDLWEKLPGAKTFRDVAHTTTDSSGNYSFVRHGVMTNRQWYTTAGSDQSATIAQQVKAVVSLSAGRGIHGRVTPNHAGERVWLEHRVGSRWLVTGRQRLSRGSTYVFAAYSCTSAGRVVFPGDRRNMLSASPLEPAACGNTY